MSNPKTKELLLPYLQLVNKYIAQASDEVDKCIAAIDAGDENETQACVYGILAGSAGAYSRAIQMLEARGFRSQTPAKPSRVRGKHKAA